MKSVIIGTAGHIDHGKTALVKALTGIDADRLKEEKRRGITIDIGFANLELPGPDGEPIRFGFVDVPGHERFVRNMLAGIGGIDILMMVVAADESVMPQTREHFDICRLLSIRRGLTVLTKSDMVDSDMLEVVRLEVEDYVRGSFLDATKAPILPVSAFTGAGLDALKAALVKIAYQVSLKDTSRFARLPIDRVFAIKGFGTVVTGTLIAGSIRREEELELFPSMKRVRVRGIQVHNAATEQADAGQRTALNLSGVNTEDLARGMMLAPPGLFHPTRSIDVSLALLPSARPLQNRSYVHLYVHATEVVAEVVFDSTKQMLPGTSSYAQLRLADPILVFPGDRFILRQLSPVITIGGGEVLNTVPLRMRKKERLNSLNAFLDVLRNGSDQEILQARLKHHKREGISLGGITAETGWRKERIEALLAQLSDKIVRFGDVLILGETADHFKAEILRLLDGHHKTNPLSPGMGREELREKLRMSFTLFSGILKMLESENRITPTGELINRSGRAIAMKDEEREAKEQIENVLSSAGLNAPLLQNVLSSLKIDTARAQKILYLLYREKLLIKIEEDIVFHMSALQDLRRRLAEFKTQSSTISVPQFKELAGVTRRYAIALLEYLDRERITRRVGEERIIV